MSVSAFAADTPVVNSNADVVYYDPAGEPSEFNQDTINGAKTCDVYASVGSQFWVTIPKTITLGSDGNAAYKVTVDADIAGTEFIEVRPSAKTEGSYAGYTLVEAGGKAPISYTVTQPKTVFIAAGSNSSFDGATAENLQALAAEVENYVIHFEEAAIVNGGIAAPDITAGTWRSAFDFNISLNTKAEVVAGE